MPSERESEITAPKPPRRVWRYVFAVLLLAVRPVRFASRCRAAASILLTHISHAYLHYDQVYCGSTKDQQAHIEIKTCRITYLKERKKKEEHWD